ncbi:unnamed protein product [Microthlaspi erraticum]|uniref:Glabrous enhancer-binding protein-like DBD domain-containing protein n=1 Tax=Microthlaspi erraticum TaxID=1685480 RepID=A0A6D2KUH8_9BRAS|nr:unnamed protein product [Microthlaspi erraticum]
MVDSSDSSSECFVIRRNNKPLKRKHVEDDDGENISGTEATLNRRKHLKKTTIIVPSSSSPPSKMTWTKKHEFVILRGILEYEKKTGKKYGYEWDVFYRYMKHLMAETSFTKAQLQHKVLKLKKRFKDNKARSNERSGLYFNYTEDEEAFNLSTIIWADIGTECADSSKNLQEQQQQKVLVSVKDVNKKTECAYSSENMQDQQQKVLVSTKNINNKTECASSNENMQEQQQTEVLVSTKDVHCAENERGSCIRTVEKEKSCEGDGDGEDNELCVLQEVLEAGTLFQSLGKKQQKFLCQNLKNLSAQRRKELTEEWEALLDEEMKLNIKKITFSAKLASSGVSA